MDETKIRAALNDYWNHIVRDPETAHAIYHADAVLEFPQSQERFIGRANFETWRKMYPAAPEFEIRRIRGQGDLWVTELLIRYDGGPGQFGCSIMEFRDGKVARETIYLGARWSAPEWRAPWRAAWSDGDAGAQPLKPPSSR